MTEVSRKLNCNRATVRKYVGDKEGKRHAVVNGVLMVHRGWDKGKLLMRDIQQVPERMALFRSSGKAHEQRNSGVHGEEYMNRLFECYMRLKHGDRYDLTRDADGFYCREVVKRMFEVWCHCKGWGL